MAAPKRLSDLTDYAAVLPYASELFGIYQPLLGWKSKRMQERFQGGYLQDKRQLLDRLKLQFAGAVKVDYRDDAGYCSTRWAPALRSMASTSRRSR